MKIEKKTLLIINLIIIAALFLLYGFDFFDSNIDKPILILIGLGIISLICSKKYLIIILMGIELLLILIYFLNITHPEIIEGYFNWIF